MSFSYAAGPTGVPLLEQTIGERLRETVERFTQREALVVPHQANPDRMHHNTISRALLNSRLMNTMTIASK